MGMGNKSCTNLLYNTLEYNLGYESPNFFTRHFQWDNRIDKLNRMYEEVLQMKVVEAGCMS